ncbi:hypothetical protein Ccrd_013280 [Cynara cardunculus var. scolymus]|uniref:Uncharacterized protein n=1 Tax=Cynara cardunculus var. scolymus TaxID=59895 RepID=A0A103YFX1_CYNCS|nr:hypothetical protein Ccrd_013280 [Cynara cardunculus var. scolymus]
MEFANENFTEGQKYILKNIHRRKPIHNHSNPQDGHPNVISFKHQFFSTPDEEQLYLSLVLGCICAKDSLLHSKTQHQGKSKDAYDLCRTIKRISLGSISLLVSHFRASCEADLGVETLHFGTIRVLDRKLGFLRTKLILGKFLKGTQTAHLQTAGEARLMEGGRNVARKG